MKDIMIEPPIEYTTWNVMYWEPESQSLVRQMKDGNKTAATLLSKSRKFLEAGCIKKVEEGFICLPLKGYNKTTYMITDGVRCNCQGFAKKLKDEGAGFCSHCLAVKMFNFMEEHNG